MAGRNAFVFFGRTPGNGFVFSSRQAGLRALRFHPRAENRHQTAVIRVSFGTASRADSKSAGARICGKWTGGENESGPWGKELLLWNGWRLPGFGPVSEQSQTQPGVFSGFCFPMVLTKILRRREATPFFSSAGRPVGSFFRVARQRRGGVAFSGVRPPQGGADSGFVWHSFPRIQSRQHAQAASRHERL